MNSHFNDEKMYTYLKGFAMGRNLPETIKSLNKLPSQSRDFNRE